MLRDAPQAARRHRFTDPRAWLGHAIVWTAAVLVGLVVVGFASLATGAFALFEALRERHPFAPLVVTPLVGMASLWLARRFFRGTEGGGIPQVIAAADPRRAPAPPPRLVSLRIGAGKLVLVCAGFAGGFAIGREGPSVQIGACVLHAARRWLPAPHAVDPRSLIIAGGAAGMAATFNTPLAGIVFGIEQLARRFDERTNGTLLAAIIWAGLVSIALAGSSSYFGRLVVPDAGLSIVPYVLGCGIACGLAGAAFNRLLLSTAPGGRLAARVRRRPIAFAGLCGLLVAVLGLATGGASFGGGYEGMETILAGREHIPWPHALARFAATVLSAISGIPGGIVGPSLSIGAGIGVQIAELAPEHVGAAAIVALCMAAYLAAVTDAPLTAFVVVMEMIDGHAMVISLMGAAMIARLVARAFGPPLFETLAAALLAPAATDAAGAPTPSRDPADGDPRRARRDRRPDDA